MRKFLQHAQTLVPDRAGIHILAFHLIQGGTQSPVDIPLEMFRNQVKVMREKGMLCTLHEAVRKLQGSHDIAEHLAVITFDDAYENFYTRAWPVIQEFEIPVTLFVPVEFVEQNSPPPIRGSESLPPCSWNQIREMVDTKLVTIGSHSCTHPDLTRLDLKSARYEIDASRKKLENKLSLPVTDFCYPKGLWSRQLEKIVRECYDTAVVGGGVKMTLDRWNPYRLTRLPIRRDMPADIVPILYKSVWLEERVASWVRPLREFFRADALNY